MNHAQFEKLQNDITPQAKVLVTELTNLEDRTLLWGYTSDRNSFHVYLKDGILNKVIYNFDRHLLRHEEGVDLNIEGITPDKRIYPSSCDFEFCTLLRSKDVYLPFTTFSEEKIQETFYGEIMVNGELQDA